MAEKQSIKMPYTYIDTPVQMTFMITNDYYMRTVFENWYSSIFNTERYKVGYKKDYSTDIVIQQLNSKNIPVFGVKLEKAFPIEMTALELSNATENDYLRMTVTFAYDKYIEENAVSSTLSAVSSVLGQAQNTLNLLG